MIIGLTGLAGSGKSVVAAHLGTLGSFERMPFAGPLKSMLAAGIGMTEAQLWGGEKESPIDWLDGVTCRHLMQTLGTDWGREMIHPEIWVRAWRQKVEARLAYHANVVVDDVRFPNEVEAIRALGGTVWRVERGMKTMGHASETQISSLDVDWVIPNYGSLDLLRERVAYTYGRVSCG